MNIHASETIRGSVEQTQEAKRRALESVARTFETLKRLIADYDVLKDERDRFETKIVSLVNENEALREQIKRIDQERDRCVQALLACASQIDVVGERCAEVVGNARAQVANTDSAMAALRKGNTQGKFGQGHEPDGSKISKDPPEELRWGSPRPRIVSETGNGLAEAKKRAPDEPDTKKPSSDAGSDEATRLMETVTDRLSKILNGEPQR